MGSADFDHAILRAVAGIEKKRSILVGVEKEVVARHEAGHALVATAVRILIPTSAAVEKLSIIPRTGGALGCARVPFLNRLFLLPFFAQSGWGAVQVWDNKVPHGWGQVPDFSE